MALNGGNDLLQSKRRTEQIGLDHPGIRHNEGLFHTQLSGFASQYLDGIWGKYNLVR